MNARGSRALGISKLVHVGDDAKLDLEGVVGRRPRLVAGWRPVVPSLLARARPPLSRREETRRSRRLRSTSA